MARGLTRPFNPTEARRVRQYNRPHRCNTPGCIGVPRYRFNILCDDCITAVKTKKGNNDGGTGTEG